MMPFKRVTDDGKTNVGYPWVVSAFALLITWVAATVAASEDWLDGKDTLDSFPRTSEDANGRLPSNVLPTHYTLVWEPSLDIETFKGGVDIHIDVVNRTDSIVLHAEDLRIYNVHIRRWDTDDEQIPKVALNATSHTITLGLSHSLGPGIEAVIHLEFYGKLRHDFSGMFLAPFTRLDGSNGTMATTQLAPTYARRAFPSFDEPSLKATFTVALVIEESLIGVSNMPIERVEVHGPIIGEPSRKTIWFQQTPRMSTYFVACAIGELRHIENGNARIPIRIYTPVGGKVESMHHAAETVARGITFYEDLFQVQYPLPKLDFIAVPTFMDNAMENWGMIVGDSSYFLFDPEADGSDRNEIGAEALLHELAHQWFGDLVTPSWWDQFWLKEGCATLMTMYCLQSLEPTWSPFEYKRTSGQGGAFEIDAYLASHPVEIPKSDKGDIMDGLDQLSYSKGALILEMLQGHLGPDLFHQGITLYLEEHAFDNAQTEDVWDAMTKISGKDVKSLMDPWTKTTGYPFISISERTTSLRQEVVLNIEQHRFLFGGNATAKEDSVWPVFLSIRTSRGMETDILGGRVGTLSISGQDGDFYVFNSNRTSLYRVKYPDDRLRKLSRAAKAGYLTRLERVALIADTCALAHAGHQKTSTCLWLIESVNEQEALPWFEISSQMQSITIAWDGNLVVLEGLTARYRKLTAKLSHRLGWERDAKDEYSVRQLKGLAFTEAGLAGDKVIIAAAQRMFHRFAHGDRNALGAVTRDGVFRIALRNGGEREYDYIVSQAKYAELEEDQYLAQMCLLATEDPSLVNRTLNAILAAEFSPIQIITILKGVKASRTARIMVWKWTRDNWDYFATALPDVFGTRHGFAKLSTRYLTTRQEMLEVETLLQKDVYGLESDLRSSLEQIRGVALWVERDTGDLEEWLGLDNNAEL